MLLRISSQVVEQDQSIAIKRKAAVYTMASQENLFFKLQQWLEQLYS